MGSTGLPFIVLYAPDIVPGNEDNEDISITINEITAW